MLWTDTDEIRDVLPTLLIVEDKFLHSIHTFEPGNLSRIYFSHCLLTKSRT